MTQPNDPLAGPTATPPLPSRGTAARVYGWQWGPDEQRRPGLPWIGIFLLVFGGLLLLERFVPGLRFAGSAFLLAVGLVFLLRWFIERRSASLYAGAIITALALPNTIEAIGIAGGPGLGMFCLGLAFLFIALVRWTSSGGIGWQAWFGAILAIYGLTRLAIPDVGQVLVPALLVVAGLLILVRGGSRTGGSPSTRV
jgi:hypothetical protein